MPTSRIVRLAACFVLVATGCEAPAYVPDATRPEPAVHVPQPVAPAEDGVSADFMQVCVLREPFDEAESDHWEMPFQSRRLAVALMIIVAQDRIDDLDRVLTPDATWGLPETRRFGARPIFGPDGPHEFVHALREAGRRLPAKPSWRTLPLTMGTQESVRSGAEPLWAFYENGGDRIYFRMVMREDKARIDYVGLFEDGPPRGPISIVGQGRPTALGPLPRQSPDAATPDAGEAASPDEAAPRDE
jgi:hypothetical protein